MVNSTVSSAERRDNIDVEMQSIEVDSLPRYINPYAPTRREVLLEETFQNPDGLLVRER